MPFGISPKDIFSAGLGWLGGEKQNRAAAEQARHANAFSASQTAQQMQFQGEQAETARNYTTEMSNTSYQRAVGDMKSAGLNPMLAYSQGGASTPTSPSPSGAAASGQQAQVVSPAVQALSSASTIATIRNIQADTDKKNAETNLTRESTPQHGSTDNLGDILKDRLTAEALRAAELVGLTKAEKELLTETIENAKDTGKNIRANTANTKVNTILHNLNVPRAKQEAEAHSGVLGKISPYVNAFGKIINSASRLRAY